jgi:hypothetical protein
MAEASPVPPAAASKPNKRKEPYSSTVFVACLDTSIDSHSVIGVYLSEEEAWKAARITLQEFAARHRIDPPSNSDEDESDQCLCDALIEKLEEGDHWPDQDEPFSISVSVRGVEFGKMPVSSTHD